MDKQTRLQTDSMFNKFASLLKMPHISEYIRLGCVSRKRRKPKLIVESIVGQILVLRAIPKDTVA